jgi:hypothetical protein
MGCNFDDDCSTGRSCKSGTCVLPTPAPTPASGGKAKKTYKGGSYVVHIGKRGGKYINVKGKKVYI